MQLIHGGKDHQFDEVLARWVLERVNVTRSLMPGSYYAIGVHSKGEIVAGALYTDYVKLGTGGKIEISFAASTPRWAHKSIILALLHYPFEQLKCHVVVATVRRKNKRSRRFVEWLGFTERGIIPNWPYDEDTVIYALRREDHQARWFRQAFKTQKVAA